MSSSNHRRVSQSISGSAGKLRPTLTKILKIEPKSAKVKRIRKELSLAKQVALSELLRDTPAKNQQDLPDFKQFLSNKYNVQLFREFLKTQYCQENIDFYLACEKYHQLDPEKVGEHYIKFMAMQIFNDHLRENAKQPVNIEYKCLENIKKQMENPTPNLLKDAQNEIFNLMRSDCYPRFCKSWRLDRATARRILSEQPTSSNSTSTPMNRTHNTTMTSDANTSYLSYQNCNPADLTVSSMASGSSKARGIKRKLCSQSQMSDASICPPSCPYFRIGLPCQKHATTVSVDPMSTNRADTEQKGTSDLIDKIDLSRLHHVPKVRRRTPPPPPLPPKPDVVGLEVPMIAKAAITTTTSAKRLRPYVSEPLDV